MGWLMSLGWIACKWLFCLCGMCGKILRGVVGAVPMCPPVSPSRGASIVHPPRTMRVFLVWKRRCANVRAGTQAPPLRVSFGWITCKWLFCLGRLCVEWLVSFGEWIVHGLRVWFGWVMRANAVNPRGRKVVGRIKPVGLVLLIAQGWRR